MHRNKVWAAAALACAIAVVLGIAGCASASQEASSSSASSAQASSATTSEPASTQAQSSAVDAKAASSASSAEEGSAETSSAAAVASSAPSASSQAAEPQEGAGGKTLVVCWSQTGNTRPLAEYVAEITGADFYEIQAEVPYTEADLDYNDSSTRATVEQQQTPEVRPAIAGELPNMGDYDTVFLAHPIWWGKAPRIVLTFLESVDLSGKTVVEFVTSGSSGIGGAEGEVHAAAPDANWLEGRRFDAGTSRDEMQAWVESLGLA